MMDTFDILCHIDIKHGYYKKACTDLHFSPTKCTANVMKYNDILLRQSSGNLSFIVSSKRTSSLSISDIVSDHFSLLFLVDTNNTYLDNISNLPDRNARQVVLYSNIDTTVSDENVYQLSTQTVVTLCEKTFTISSQEWIDNTVMDCFGNIITPKFDKSGDIVALNIVDLDEGIYRIETKKGTHYFTNFPLGFREKPLALLHICTNESLLKNRTCLQPRYTISMDAIAPFWQYVLPSEKVEKYNIESLFVETSDQSIEFTQDASNVTNGYVTFTSKSPILLESQKDIRFRLKKVNGEGIQDSIIIPDLPHPQIDTLIKRQEEHMVTPIYVKI